MHLMIAVDANEVSHKLVGKFIASIPLHDKNGKERRAVAREIRLYNVIVDESCLPEFMPIIKTHEKVSLSGRVIGSAISLLSKFFPFLSPIDTSKYERYGGKQDKIWWREHFPGTLPPYMMIIGSIPDIKNEDELDML